MPDFTWDDSSDPSSWMKLEFQHILDVLNKIVGYKAFYFDTHSTAHHTSQNNAVFKKNHMNKEVFHKYNMRVSYIPSRKAVDATMSNI